MGACGSSDDPRDSRREDSYSRSETDDRADSVATVSSAGSLTIEMPKDGGDTSDFPFVPSDHSVKNVYELFDIERELGRGASCKVMEVSRKTDGARFAMKEMRRDDKWNPMLFEQECRILQKLAGHDNVLHYEDCYIDTKNFYILTKLCTGGELFDKIKSLRHFNEAHAIEVTRTILDAMAYCHKHNVVHRDLKPENIVYETEAQDKLVIIDYGDAKEVEQESEHDDFVGTAFYLAPEAIRKRLGWELKKSDMWTIGVITYVLVTGRPPFWGRENKEIIRKIIRGNVRFPSTIKLSQNCKNFILSLLQKEPEKRMSAEQALEHPWIKGQDKDREYGEEILKSLATFGKSNALKRLIVETVAANLDKKHRREYVRQFEALDLKKDGSVDWQELQAFLVKLGLESDVAEDRAKELVSRISGDYDKPITINDWNHANVAKLLSSDHLIARQYKKLDVDEDGMITKEDLLSIFEDKSEEDIEAMIDEIDMTNDGLINFEEFRRAMAFEPAYVHEDDIKL
jgi:calcium-dependent protein kinase